MLERWIDHTQCVTISLLTRTGINWKLEEDELLRNGNWKKTSCREKKSNHIITISYN